MNKSFFDTRTRKIICIILGSIIILYQVPSFFRSFVCTVDQATGECVSMDSVKDVRLENLTQGLKDSYKHPDSFSTDYSEKIEPICPFYKPDRESYRNCLIDLLHRKEDSSSKTKEQIGDIIVKCYGNTKAYGPTEDVDATAFFAICVISMLDE